MNPYRFRWDRMKQRVRCWLDIHEDTQVTTDAVAATDEAPAELATLRHRCIHCLRETEGWRLDGPRYTITQAGDPGRMVLHNPRLRRCACRACEERRKLRRQKVTDIRRTG